jgi:phage gpG-like protein
MAVSVKVSGGKNWRKALASYAESGNAELKVGILEGASYSGETGKAGMPVAMIAAAHEFGGEIAMPERKRTVYFKQTKDGVGNRFAKKAKSDFAQDATVGAHTITIPARSFMRSTLEKKKEEWISAAAGHLKASPGDVRGMLEKVGETAAKDMQAAIEEGIAPALKPATVKAKLKRKGSKGSPDLPLVDTGTMQEAISYEVTP